MNLDFVPSRMYNFVRSRQLEGTFELGPETGVFPITSHRIAKGWGFPPEQAWPYDGVAQNWPPKEEPFHIDTIAKEFRIGVYQRVRSLEECKLFIDNLKPVLLTLPIYHQWFNSTNGCIEIPDILETNKGHHAITIYAYDDLKSELTFANSWGEKWGDNGYGYLPYSYYNNWAVEAWTITDINSELRPMAGNSIQIVNYGICDLLADIIHVIEIFDHKNNEIIGWSSAVIRNEYLDIEEFFIHPNYRHRGYGIHLSEEILRLRKHVNLPIRMWIPDADVDRDNFYVIEKILHRMNLNCYKSEVSWARYKCI